MEQQNWWSDVVVNGWSRVVNTNDGRNRSKLAGPAFVNIMMYWLSIYGWKKFFDDGSGF